MQTAAAVPQGRDNSNIQAANAQNEIDAIDRKLLMLIANDPMATHLAVSKRLLLSPSTALRRRQRLEEVGAIAGYRTLIDQRALGRRERILVEIELANTDAVTVAFVWQVLAQFGALTFSALIVGTPGVIAGMAVHSASAATLQIRRALEGLDAGASACRPYPVT